MSAVPSTTVPVITPSRLGRYLEKKLGDDRHLRYVGIQGEVSNLRVQANGNLYFSLKDRDAVVNCVAFAERAATFPACDNGADVVVFGEVKIYGRQSTYQLVAAKLELAGVGALHAKYEELSRKLQREGLFADARKRALPRFPFRVALVGSPSGDGTRDFLTQARERAPQVAVRLFETPVNGVGAVPDIVRAIAAADAFGADILVVVRGGGSYEDLFGFSDERVVRAIAACATPTVAAIGHERDQPLIELAADVRASTPSKAAQTMLPKRDDLLRVVGASAAAHRRAFALRLERAHRALDRIEHRSPLADRARLLASRRQAVDAIERRLQDRSPAAQLGRRRERVRALAAALERVPARLARRVVRVAEIRRRLTAAATRVVERRGARFAMLETKLKGLDPDAWLKLGYAMVYDAAGRLVRDPADAPPGTRIEARLARGSLHARVEREGTDDGEQITLF